MQEGKRYRLLMHNNSGDVHPVHTHRHTFEVTKVGDRSMSGLMKDTLSIRGTRPPKLILPPTIQE